jgi:hypothetical protein
MASSNRTRRIAKEIADIQNDQLSKIVVEPAGNGDDLTHLKGQFLGPPDTPYEGGTFHVDIKIPSEYPFRPPVMRFETKMWHPNVSSQTVSTHDTTTQFYANPAGRHLPRHAIVPMVPRPDHQIRPHLPTVPPQHTRAQRSTRCRSRRHADTEPQGVRVQGTRVVGEVCRRTQEGDRRGQRGRDCGVDQEEAPASEAE